MLDSKRRMKMSLRAGERLVILACLRWIFGNGLKPVHRITKLVLEIELCPGKSDIGRRKTLPACMLKASHAVKESADAEPAAARLGPCIGRATRFFRALNGLRSRTRDRASRARRRSEPSKCREFADSCGYFPKQSDIGDRRKATSFVTHPELVSNWPTHL